MLRCQAPPEVVALLERPRTTHRIPVRVPVQGRVRAAAVPGVHLPLAAAVEIAGAAASGQAETPWAGAALRSLGALSSAVGRFVGAGHVVPRLGRLDGCWDAGWRLVDSPQIAAWRTESLSRCHGLVSSTEELQHLLGALTDLHVHDALRPLAGARRSDFGEALVSGGEPRSADHALAETVGEFARAAAARDVAVVFRVQEPSAAAADEAESDDPADHGGQSSPLWRLEALVRTGTDTLRPVSELPDPTPVLGPVHDVVERARRCWPRLADARRAAGSVDLLLSTELLVELVDEGVQVLRGHGVEILLPRAWTRVRTAVRVVVGEPGTEAVDSGRRLGLDQLADVDWELLVDDEPLDAAELQALLVGAGDLVRLRGHWVRADPGALRRAARFLELARGEGGPVTRLVRALASEEAAGVEVVGPPPHAWPAATASADPVLPDWFRATLRPYQQEGVRWLAGLAAADTGAVLADDMGLGKTMQVLALTAAEHRTTMAAGRTPGPTLVVAPLTLLDNWRREARTFAPGLRVLVHHGSSRARGAEATDLMVRADLVLTSYGTAARDRDLLAGVPWRRLVADEAQTVKNPATAIARALASLPAEHRVALTGTPVENRLDELRAILDFVNPGLLGSASTFRARFAVPIESHRDVAAASRLRTLTAPFVLRRLKSDPRVAADLPAKEHIRIDAPLTREQATLYQAVVEDMLEQVRESTGGARKGAILSGLTALKQVCNHPAHYLGDGSALLRGGRHRSGKLAALDRVLTEILDSGEKVLIFTQYRVFGDLVLPMLSRRATVAVPFLHGGVTAAERAAMVEAFQRTDGPPVMLASLRAGGTGLTLTEANHVVHLDRWWNPAVENQATDRVHRIGQTRRVQVRTLVAPGTVEDRIDELLAAKSDLAELTLGPLAGALTELDDDKLAELVALSTQAVAE